jgi:SWIM zinc finger
MATVSIVAPIAPDAPPLPRPILGIDRRTGAFLALVPSCSQPGLFHITTASRCSCKGFQFRGRCRHITTAQTERGIQDGGQAHLQVMRAADEWPTVSPEVAAKAAIYHSIFSEAE